jgi:16S rRNA processing protein RimM
VLEVIEQPVQILLRIELQGKEVLVPLNESTLDKIDHKQGKIYVTLPDGLLDIYLN